MAKILTFRNKGSGTSGQDFLTDENEKLSFRTSADGAVSLGNVSSTALPDLKKDWGNQELADLFRVGQLLSGANVPVETLRGITDEGDPWFVFCHLNGDVFIHMARIDEFYVLDSPNVHRPLRGRDFNALVADFTNHALPTSADKDDTTERRVIRLDRGGKVRLHPSAMLAALIWTLFLASEDLVLLAPEEQTADNDELLDFADVIADDFDFQTMAMEAADTVSLGVPEEMKEASEDAALHGTPETYLQMREAMGQQGMATQQNAYAMGLSTIAIAMGFMSEAVLHDNQRKVLDGLGEIGLAQYAASPEAGPQLEQIVGESGDALLAMLAEFLGFDLSLNTGVAEAQTNTTEVSLLQQDILHATKTAVEDPTSLVLSAIKTAQENLRKDDDTDLSETASAEAAKEINLETYIATASVDADTATLTMSDIMNGKVQLEEFQLGQTTIKASFDVTTSAFSLSDYIVVNQRTTAHREFDDNVQAFIDFIQAKETDVGVVKFGNEIIMIDRGAFIEGGVETYSFSWETNEGQFISMIGLRSEFQQFDLIA